MPSPIGPFSYTQDTYAGQTKADISHEGKMYRVSTSGNGGDHSAVVLFADPETMQGKHWVSKGKGNTMFFEDAYGVMKRAEGPWVQIRMPEAKEINGYELRYNLVKNE